MVGPAVAAQLDDLAEERMRLQMEFNTAVNIFRTKTAAVEAQIWKIFVAELASLFAKGYRSFLTGIATFQIEEHENTRKLTITPGPTTGVLIGNMRLIPSPVTSTRRLDNDGNVIAPRVKFKS